MSHIALGRPGQLTVASGPCWRAMRVDAVKTVL